MARRPRRSQRMKDDVKDDYDDKKDTQDISIITLPYYNFRKYHHQPSRPSPGSRWKGR